MYCIDPLKHGLLFERFLNPKRVSMPDIDSDFSKSEFEYSQSTGSYGGYDNNGHYHNGTQANPYRKPQNASSKTYNDYPWYCGSSGDQSLNFQLKGGKSFILDETVHIDGCRTYQDAYGIRVNLPV